MKFSVIIITRNRREDIRRTIAGYRRQTYENKEIILVDNGSTDGTREMMAEEFAEIKYFWIPDNFDIRAINIGIELSDGDVIWRTDDDSYPEDENAFAQVAEIFRQHEDIHVIATEDVEVRLNNRVWQWYPLEVDKDNIPEKGYPANVFAGTGAAIRRKVYDKIGGFWEFGFEELDFCTRAIIAGFNIRYFPNIRTLHWASPSNRIQSVRWVKVSKQLIRYNCRYFPFAQAVSRTIWSYFFQLLMGVIQRIKFSALLEGAFGMIATAIGTWRDERNVVSREKIPDITLGVSLFRSQSRYILDLIRKKIFRRKSGD